MTSRMFLKFQVKKKNTIFFLTFYLKDHAVHFQGRSLTSLSMIHMKNQYICNYLVQNISITEECNK